MSDIRQLRLRILDISCRHKLGHISSCLTALDIIDEIYAQKLDNEPFILSSGHAFLALAVVLESRYRLDAEDMIERHGVHPTRNLGDKVWYTTGSLGCGITAACGFALADRTRKVYCLISDGECSEPDVFGALNFARDNSLDNLIVYVNINGYSAYKKLDISSLICRLKAFWDKIEIRLTDNDALPYLSGIDGHYKVLNDDEYREICAQI